MTFNEYLNVDLTDSQKIFDFYLSYLGELSGKNFPFEEQVKLKGAAGKFIHSIDKTSYLKEEQKGEYYNLIEDFQKKLKYYRRNSFRLIPSFSPSLKHYKIQDSFENLYSTTLELINEASNKTFYLDDLEINDFYKPDNSNKHKIEELILEAIDLIRIDETLTEKTKKNLIVYLEKTLKELERKSINWTRFLGKIKQTVIVLGALGSVIGGISPLIKAQEKLEQTTTIIQNTSINLNYKVLNETFNLHSIKHINVGNIIELPENIEDVEVEEISENEDDKY